MITVLNNISILLVAVACIFNSYSIYCHARAHNTAKRWARQLFGEQP